MQRTIKEKIKQLKQKANEINEYPESISENRIGDLPTVRYLYCQRVVLLHRDGLRSEHS